MRENLSPILQKDNRICSEEGALKQKKQRRIGKWKVVLVMGLIFGKSNFMEMAAHKLQL